MKLWGVRGSIACPTPRHIAFGGNTSCIEVRAGDERFILDAGTGIRELGDLLLESDIREAKLLLTHTHWDHICGFPFFGPFFREEWKFGVYAGHLTDSGGVRAALAGQMMRPMFPVPLEALRADVTFHDFPAGSVLEIGDVVVKTAKLNHPDGATGYRIEHGGKSLCYVTDTEHIPGEPDKNVLALIEGADMVIYDSTYTDEEFPAHVGWGHSTWQEGVRLCRAANVGTLVIFHHDPSHNDDFMSRVEEEAVAMWESAIVGREGMTFLL